MGKTAFLFPGQGSQIVGMGKDLYDHFVPAKAYYQSAESILGFDLTQISFNGPEEELKQTRYTQPALFVHSIVLALLLKERGVEAEGAAGHSLGEYSALCYGGAFRFEDGLAVVRERARLMQEAGEKSPGSMAAIIGLEAAHVTELCVLAGKKDIVQPANFNSPQQIVVSGSVAGVSEVIRLAKEAGAKRAIELPVSGAFHSPLMEYAVKDFGSVLESTEIHDVDIPVYANVSALPVQKAAEIRSRLHDQLTHSVRWVETIDHMIQDGFDRFIEVGAGKVLTGLVKRYHRDVQTENCGTLEDLEKYS